MYWVTISWSMVATASAMLALVHGFYWVRQRESLSSLLFAMMAAATSAMAGCELMMMKAAGPAAYGAVLRWYQVAVWIAFLSVLGFVQLQLGGRRWLAWFAAAVRTVSLIPNFVGAPNVNFREITSVHRIRFLGEDIGLAVGAPNPWMLLAQFGLLLLMVYVLDATWRAWRMGNRRQALTVGGALIFFVSLASLQAILVFWGIIRVPLMASPFFLSIVSIMGFELSSELLRAARLAKELQSKRAELEHLSRVASLSELSGSLAHELNQPLAIILSNAQAAQRLLTQQPPDLAEVREILADIVHEDRRAGDVIGRLRAMLKRGEPDRRPLRLNDAAEEVLLLTRNDLLHRGIHVQREFAPALPLILGDRIPIEQVMLNLVINACDAVSGNAPGDRHLKVATCQDDKGVGFLIQDNGCGLPEDLECVFRPFYTTKPNGLGMGLSICMTIISAHGGRLWAERNPDSGATFRFYFPVPEVSV